MTTNTEPGTVDDLIADARELGMKVTQRMIMDWQTIGLMDYPTPQGGKGRGHGSKKALYSGNQRQLFSVLLKQRARKTKILNLTRLPVYFWIYWGDDYVPLRQMRLALKFYVNRALKPSLEGCRQSAAAVVAQIRHPKASQTSVNKLERMLAEAMYDGRGMNDRIKAEMQVVFDPFDEQLTLGPSGVPLSANDVMCNAVAVELAANALSRDDPRVSDELFYESRALLRVELTSYLRHQPDLALYVGSLTQELTPGIAEILINNCWSALLFNLGLCMMEAGSDDNPSLRAPRAAPSAQPPRDVSPGR